MTEEEQRLIVAGMAPAPAAASKRHGPVVEAGDQQFRIIGHRNRRGLGPACYQLPSRETRQQGPQTEATLAHSLAHRSSPAMLAAFRATQQIQ